MADTPREPTAFERDLDNRVANAKAEVEQSHSDLFPPQGAVEAEPTPTEVVKPAAQSEDLINPPPADAPKPEVKAEEAPKAAAPAQANQPPEGFADWQSYRRYTRQQKRMEKELEALKASGKLPPAAQPAEMPQQIVPQTGTTFDENDPFGVEARIRAMRGEFQQQISQQQAQWEQARVEQRLEMEENAFRSTHPRYTEAVNHVINTGKTWYKSTGGAGRDGMTIKATLERNSRLSQDPGQRQAAAQAIQQMEDFADQNNMTDDQAYEELAAQAFIAKQRNDLIATGNVPNRVWQIATEQMGFQAEDAAPAQVAQAPVTTQSTQPASAADRIRQQARATAAGKSLSNVTGVGAPQAPAEIQTVGQFTAWFQKDPQAARRYLLEKSRQDPQWHRKLAP